MQASRHAAVDDQHLSGNRLGSAEGDHLVRDVLGARGPAQHDLAPCHLDYPDFRDSDAFWANFAR